MKHQKRELRSTTQASKTPASEASPFAPLSLNTDLQEEVDTTVKGRGRGRPRKGAATACTGENAKPGYGRVSEWKISTSPGAD